MNEFIEQIPNLKESALFENCEKQINQIYNFLQSNQKIFLLNGFLGSGKTTVLNFVAQNLKPEVLTIRYNCFETTILDDMLLSFFESFRNFTLEGRIVPPKVKAENFTQKINLYFNSTSSPIVIMIDSFSAILRDNKPEILSFIQHISKLNNVKIIIASRVFNLEDFENSQSATVLAFTKENFEKFLKQNEIKNIGVLSNELYKQTKGYYHYINLSVKIMKLRDYNLGKFLEVFSKSMMSFSEFIMRDALSMIDPVSLHLFRLLAVMRIPIHVNLLKSLHMYNEKQAAFFVNNSLLAADGEFLYLPDYYREIIERQIQDSVMLKLHRACVELYETQLPLKPLERDLRLSRQTMRNEIDYHSLFIPKPVVIPAAKQPEPPKTPEIEILPQKQETKEEQIEKINFIIENENMLDNIADSIKEFVTDKAQKHELIDNSSAMSLTQLLNEAHQQEINYDFKSAAILYQTALTKKNEAGFDSFLPTIYTKLATTYKKLSQWYEALEYYTKAQDYYFNVSDSEKVCEIKLEMANIYYSIYKHDNAKYILDELKKEPGLANDLRIKVNIALAKLTDNTDDELVYYRDSLSLVDYTTSKVLCAELFYRYGAACDEKGDMKTAAIYYQKCIETEQNPKLNHYLSRAYANIAQLCDETGNSEHAIKYFLKSIETDKLIKNYNGLYSNLRALSEIYAPKDNDKALECLIQAQDYAQKLNEPYYMADISMQLGNYYLVRQNYQESYKYFVQAYDVAKHSFTKDNTDKILSQIEYLKSIGVDNA